MFQRSWGLPTWASKYPQASPPLASLHGASSRGLPRIHSSLESLGCSSQSLSNIPRTPIQEGHFAYVFGKGTFWADIRIFPKVKASPPSSPPPFYTSQSLSDLPRTPTQEGHFAYMFEKGAFWTDLRIFLFLKDFFPYPVLGPLPPRASQTSPGPPSRRVILHTCSRKERSGGI